MKLSQRLRAAAHAPRFSSLALRAFLGALLVSCCGVACSAANSLGDSGGASSSGAGPSYGICASASGPAGTATATKVDLLLMIDNSRSMADKQNILVLANALPYLVKTLVEPPCVDPATGAPTTTQPAGPADACAAGSKREFAPILDLHIGIVTSSLGGHGSDACPEVDTSACNNGNSNTSQNDHGHLVDRNGACTGQTVPTYQSEGFLAWDPGKVLTPPGEATLGDQPGSNTGLIPPLANLVVGVDQIGCGYEAQLESWYRFLVDPQPYINVTIENGVAVPTTVNGSQVDNVLLAQRADFLRPDSLVAILMLTDENDGSLRDFGQFYYAEQQRTGNPPTAFHMPRPSAACAVNPNDPCCYSCGQKAPANCPADPTCQMNSGVLTAVEDNINQRMYDTKRRFGIDFLYPISRYTTGLSCQLVPNAQGELFPNPLFPSLANDGGSAPKPPGPSGPAKTVREPGGGLVFLAGIVGVPWQDIARQDATGKPNLLMGIDTRITGKNNQVGGNKSYAELNEKADGQHTGWEILLGDPDNYVPPLDPHMIETWDVRSGANPITGAAIQPPTAANGADPINGHEFSIPLHDDLQYACIFQLPTPRDCSDPAQVSCDCTDPMNDDPLCEPDPKHNNGRTLQAHAKGYPGIREIQAIQSIGPQGILASICGAQMTDATQADYGYRPAARAVIDAIKVHLE